MRIDRSKLALIILLALFFFVQFIALSEHTQSFYFGDETEHLVPAWMMIKDGNKLYTHFSTVHQPLPILTSFLFLSLVKFQSLFMLIEKLRQFMFLISFLGALLVTIRFRDRGFVAALLVESIRFYFFGYHLLAESLIVYPTMLIVGLISERFILNRQISENQRKIDDLLFGLSLFWIALNFLQAWLFLALAIAYYSSNRSKATTLRVGLSALIPTSFLFISIDPVAWFQETMVNPLLYIIPYQPQVASINAKLSLFIYPFLSFLSLESKVSQFFTALSLMGVISSIILLHQVKNRKRLVYVLISLYVMVIVLNLRIPETNIAFYSAFHVLPLAAAYSMFIATLIGTTASLILEAKWRRVFNVFFISFMLLALGKFSEWWFESKDKLNDHYIQYGEVESVGQAFRALKVEQDRLLVGNVDGYIHIVADIPPATRQNAHLPWAFRSPKLRQEFIDVIDKSPPTFIYFPESQNPYYVYLAPILEEKYTRLSRLDGGLTNAYILNRKIEDRSPNQWHEFEKLYWKIPGSKT